MLATVLMRQSMCLDDAGSSQGKWVEVEYVAHYTTRPGISLVCVIGTVSTDPRTCLDHREFESA